MQVEVEHACVAQAPPSEGGCRRNNKHSRRLLHAILLAQLLSVVLVITGVSSASLAGQGVVAPTIQAFFSYCLLAIVYGSAQLLLPLARQLSSCRQAPVKYSGLGTAGSSSGGGSHQCGTADSSLQEPCSHTPDDGTAMRASSWQRMRKMWPAFAALALIDVEANVLVVKAYQYTSLTSVTLLDCFTIPSVMLLSWLLLHSRYRLGHFLGAALCVSGLALLVLGDARSADPAGGPAGNSSSSLAAPGALDSWAVSSSIQDHQQLAGVNVTSLASAGLVGEGIVLAGSRAGQLQEAVLPDAAGSQGGNSSSSGGSSSPAGSAPLLGDVLVLLGALLYAVCNVTQELILGDVLPGELLAGIGVFGALLSGLQAVLLGEWQSLLAAANASPLPVVAAFAGFASSMLCFYSLVPHVLMLGGATVLNISLLSSDAWAALARFLWFGGFGGTGAYFFLGSLVMVASGIVVYALSGSPKDPDAAPTARGGDAAAAAAAAVEAPAIGRGAAAAGSQDAGRMHSSRQSGVAGYSRLMSEGDKEDQQAMSVRC